MWQKVDFFVLLFMILKITQNKYLVGKKKKEREIYFQKWLIYINLCNEPANDP